MEPRCRDWVQLETDSPASRSGAWPSCVPRPCLDTAGFSVPTGAGPSMGCALPKALIWALSSCWGEGRWSRGGPSKELTAGLPPLPPGTACGVQGQVSPEPPSSPAPKLGARPWDSSRGAASRPAEAAFSTSSHTLGTAPMQSGSGFGRRRVLSPEPASTCRLRLRTLPRCSRPSRPPPASSCASTSRRVKCITTGAGRPAAESLLGRSAPGLGGSLAGLCCRPKAPLQSLA